MQAILSSLDKRWRRSTCRMPELRWQTCLFITCNAVLLSMLLLDGPVGAGHVPPVIRRLGRVLTDFGTSGWIIIVSTFLFFEGLAALRVVKSLRTRIQALQMCWIGAYLLIAIAMSGVLANILKRAIGRARPQHFDEHGIFSFSPFSGHAAFESFPSGHATTIGAFFAALSLLFPRYRVVFLACALWLGMTRVMVSAHYPSDVIAGLALGSWFSLMIAIVFSRYGILFKLVDGWPAPKRMLRA